MEWSKAKNILIVLLLLVNIFLFGVYISRTGEARNDELLLRTEICEILKKQGIEVSEELIPMDSAEILPATVGVRSIGKKTTEGILGRVTETADGDYTTFSGEKGTMMLTRDSFSLVYESGREIKSEAEAKALAEEIAEKLSVSYGEETTDCKKSDGGYLITIPQSFAEIRLFGCDIEIKVSEGGSVIAHGSYICTGDISTYRDDVVPPSALMLSFADAVKKEGYSGVTVSDIVVGYSPRASDGESLSLTPVLGIYTEYGAFYVDMQTEKVSVE